MFVLLVSSSSYNKFGEIKHLANQSQSCTPPALVRKCSVAGGRWFTQAAHHCRHHSLCSWVVDVRRWLAAILLLLAHCHSICQMQELALLLQTPNRFLSYFPMVKECKPALKKYICNWVPGTWGNANRQATAGMFHLEQGWWLAVKSCSARAIYTDAEGRKGEVDISVSLARVQVCAPLSVRWLMKWTRGLGNWFWLWLISPLVPFWSSFSVHSALVPSSLLTPPFPAHQLVPLTCFLSPTLKADLEMGKETT